MQAAFDIQRVSLGGPIFDLEKLRWLNGLWLREDLTVEQLADRLIQWGLNKDALLSVLPHVQQRMETLSDFAPKAGFLAAGMLELDEQDFAANKLSQEDQLKVLQFTLWLLEGLPDWQREPIFAGLKSLAEGLEIKLKEFLAPLFIAIAGSTSSFSVMDAMVLLGSDISRARIRHAIEVLGGLSKKRLKALDKEFRALTKG